jgi:hypothetical protein
MKTTLKKSTTNERKWRRWLSGGALVLALAGHLGPAPATAMIDIGEEVIEIEDTAPWTPPNWGGHTGGGAPNGTPGGDSGGGGGGGGGGVSVPSAGGSTPKPSPAARRLANAKQDCSVLEGVWGTAVFKDIDTNVAFAGYSCRMKYPDGTYTWLYYDSEGYLNQRCNGTLEVQTCEAP